MKIIYVVVASFFISQAALAFQDDYIWQEKFEKEMAKATTGTTKSQYKIGTMYKKGQGVKKDTAQALMWYTKAAEKNHAKALYEVAYFHYKGIATVKNPAKAYKFMLRSADKGYARAQHYVGEMYEHGSGVGKDLDLASNWYSRASLGGYSAAGEAMARLNKSTTGKSNSKPAAKQVAKVTKTKKAKAQLVKVAVKEKTMSDMILEKNWVKGKRPVEFLPSAISQCKKISQKVIECMSDKRSRDIMVAKIDYETKSMVFDISNNGEFKVVYRNNILKIRENKAVASDEEGGTEEEDYAEDETTQLTTGWQETEHQLDCKVDAKGISCVKNKTRKMKLTAVNPKGVVAKK